MSNDYMRFKHLLLDDELKKLKEMNRTIQTLEYRQEPKVLTRELSKIITDILAKSVENDNDRLYETLQPIIAKGLVEEIKDEDRYKQKLLLNALIRSLEEHIPQKKQLSDLLAPMMGRMMQHYLMRVWLTLKKSTIFKGIITLIALSIGVYAYNSVQAKPQERIEKIIATQLNFSVYGLEVERDGKKYILRGLIKHQSDKAKIERVLQDYTIVNRIDSIDENFDTRYKEEIESFKLLNSIHTF